MNDFTRQQAPRQPPRPTQKAQGGQRRKNPCRRRRRQLWLRYLVLGLFVAYFCHFLRIGTIVLEELEDGRWADELQQWIPSQDLQSVQERLSQQATELLRGDQDDGSIHNNNAKRIKALKRAMDDKDLEHVWKHTVQQNQQCTNDPQRFMPPMLQKPTTTTTTTTTKDTKAPHWGVLVDAARHYFPMDWLYRLVDVLEVLGFDLIHFRLTDDQSFAVNLTSFPELAVPVMPPHVLLESDTTTTGPQVYTPQELRAWVEYAAQHNVMVMPEVDVPSHAASWYGVPGMVPPCVGYLCKSGYSVPLNVTNPRVWQVLTSVLREVRDIFPHSPYFHLGGDEVHLGVGCYQEVLGRRLYERERAILLTDTYLEPFETQLANMLLQDLEISQVVRWEPTGLPVPTVPRDRINTYVEERRLFHHERRRRQREAAATAPKRAGDLIHYWDNQPRSSGAFVSTNLYLDSTTQDANAWELHQTTHKLLGSDPVAVVVGTFELGPCDWYERNVWGKLIAVSMAAAGARQKQKEGKADSEKQFLEQYRFYCGSLGVSGDLCELNGTSVVNSKTWEDRHTGLRYAWKRTVCERGQESNQSG